MSRTHTQYYIHTDTMAVPSIHPWMRLTETAPVMDTHFQSPEKLFGQHDTMRKQQQQQQHHIKMITSPLFPILSCAFLSCTKFGCLFGKLLARAKEMKRMLYLENESGILRCRCIFFHSALCMHQPKGKLDKLSESCVYAQLNARVNGGKKRKERKNDMMMVRASNVNQYLKRRIPQVYSTHSTAKGRKR